MNQTVVIAGIGELGGVFAKGFLRLGYSVCPVTRETSMSNAARNCPEPLCVLVAVTEKDLSNVLATVPVQWQDRLGLLQNELLPHHWKAYNIHHPTVVVVWFEKKKGQDVKVLLPSRIYGPHFRLFADALERLDIPSQILASEDEMLFELVFKNLFVLTVNIAGLKTGGTVGSLWFETNDLARRVAHDVIKVQERLIGISLPVDRLIDGLEVAVNGDPKHNCVGRASPERLARVLKVADDAGLDIPAIREIYESSAIRYHPR